MSIMHVRPELAVTARTLKAAIKAAGSDYPALARAVGVSPNTILNRVSGRSGVKEAAARAMAEVLGCDWQPLVSPPVPRGRQGRPRGSKNILKTAPGPATKALALHETAPLSPPAALLPKPTPVLGLRMLSDGTAHVSLDVTLPAERGAALFRMLLDFEMTKNTGETR